MGSNPYQVSISSIFCSLVKTEMVREFFLNIVFLEKRSQIRYTCLRKSEEPS